MTQQLNAASFTTKTVNSDSKKLMMPKNIALNSEHRANSQPTAIKLARVEQIERNWMLCLAYIVGMVSLLMLPQSGIGQVPPDLETTIKASLPCVVKIFGSGGLANLEGYGSGIIISSNGYIMTVWNHILDRGVVTVVLDDGRRFDATRVGVEPSLDLAILKIEAEGLSFIDPKQATMPPIGMRVLGFSNMFKVAGGNEPVSVIHGVVAAVAPLQARRGSFEFPYQGDAIIVDAITNNPGAAGGLLMSVDGVPLGMIGKELKDRRINVWINYALPLTELAQTAEEIITGKFKPADYAKKTLDDEPVELARYTPLDLGLVMVPDVVYRTPCFIDHVRTESLGAKLELQPDDLILFLNDELVQSQQELREMLGRMNPGDPVRMTIRRGGRLKSVSFSMPLKAELQ